MDKAKTVKNAQPTIKLSDIDFVPILVGVLVILVTLAIFFLWKKKSLKRTTVLLTGLCDSGKTILFSQLLYGELRETFTSIAENIDDYTNDENGKTVRIVDIPGNERLRGRFFDQYKNTAKAIVYVIDSVTVQKDIRDVADYLYTLLADATIASVPVLILCNKQDETLAKGSSVIKSLLEKELNLVRNSRKSQLQSVDNSATDTQFIGKQGKDFEFSHLPQSIDLAECSAKENELDAVAQWIEQLL